MGDSSTIDIKGDADDLEKELNRSTSLMGAFKVAAVGAFAVIGAAFIQNVVSNIASWGPGLYELYNTQIQAETKLAGVIRATGGAAGYTLDQMKTLASQMQVTTGVGDEVTLNAMAIISTFKNIHGEAFVEATQAAIDLSAVLGGDLNGAAMQVAKALNDPVRGMAALSRSGVSFTEEQKQLVQQLVSTGDMLGAQKVILAELSGEFGGVAAEKAKTFGGQLDALKGRLGDLGERVFAVVVPALDSMMPLLEGLVNFLENLTTTVEGSSDSLEGFADSGVAKFVKGLEWMAEIAVYAFTAVETYLSNWSAKSELSMIKFQLRSTYVWEETKYWLTDIIPPLLQWFAENWQNIFTDLGNITAAIFENLWTNVSDFFTSVKNVLNGDPAEWRFTALEIGFESTMKALPDIAERELTQIEKDLDALATHMEEQISGSFDKRYAENRALFLGMFERDMGSTERPEADPTKRVIAGGGGGALAGGSGSGSGGSGGFEELTALYTRIAGSALKTPEEELVEAVKDFGDVVDDMPERVAEATAPTNDALVDRVGELVYLMRESISTENNMLTALNRQPSSVA